MKPDPIINELYVIRHGHKDTTTGGLTHTGRRQINELANKLSKRVDELVVFSSPMRRAYESADILKKYIPVVDSYMVPSLKEGTKKVNRQEIQDTYDIIMRQEHDIPIALVGHRNTSISLIRKIANQHEYMINFDYLEFDEGDAIYVPSRPCLIDFIE